jgi:gliding motility-associated-like protein
MNTFKDMLRKLLTLVTIFLAMQTAQAAHIVGGEIYYDRIGSDLNGNPKYVITIHLYRECASTGFDAVIGYRVYHQNDSAYTDEQFFCEEPIFATLPLVDDDPCVTPPTNMCIEGAVYRDTIVLPLYDEGYYISYQRCCWSASMENIVNPGDNGITLKTFIPGADLVSEANNNARFTNYPPLVLCSGLTLHFDHSGLDPDGDSLVYELITPLAGGDSFIPDPDEPPGPYQNIEWEVGFSAIQPFGPGSDIDLDSTTGIIDFHPNMIGNYVVGIGVREYRNELLISQKIRTFGYRVVTCDVAIPIQLEITSDTLEVDGSTVPVLESCGSMDFIINRLDADEELIVRIAVAGSATNGVDYTFLPDTLIMPVNVLSDTITISSFYDGIEEGDENIDIYIILPNLCGATFDTTAISVVIADYLPMLSTHSDTLKVCADFNETGQIYVNVTQGMPPYAYEWDPSNVVFSDNDSVIVLPGTLESGINEYTVTVTDACSKQIVTPAIYVDNRCPAVVPNVITADGNHLNDLFVIDNLTDYPAVAVKIFNRWGVLVYETEKYANDWSGKDMKGNDLESGTYFYMVTPASEKYTYDDQEETKFTLHGFVQIVR